MKIVENQFDNHLLFEMVLRVDVIFLCKVSHFFAEYIFFNVVLHYVREIKFLRNVDFAFAEVSVRAFWRQMPVSTLLLFYVNGRNIHFSKLNWTKHKNDGSVRNRAQGF